MKLGRTVALQHLTQALDDLDPQARVLDSVESIRRVAQTTTGEVTASALLERFGFTGDRLTARLGDLSGGERRRFQLLRLLLTEPNVLLLDEPTNDLDIETLNVLEDFLDDWPGTLVVVSHDRYFLERVTDVTYGAPRRRPDLDAPRRRRRLPGPPSRRKEAVRDAPSRRTQTPRSRRVVTSRLGVRRGRAARRSGRRARRWPGSRSGWSRSPRARPS